MKIRSALCCDQHHEIVEAFAARAADATRELVRRHIVEAHESVVRLMARGQEEVA